VKSSLRRGTEAPERSGASLNWRLVMDSDKWIAIMLIGIVFSMASCEAIIGYSNAQVEIAKIECT